MRAFQGFPIPNISFAMGRIDLVTNVKLRTLQSAVDTVVACMAISTSLSLGAGLSTSLNCRRSGDPYWLCRIAFTSAPGLAGDHLQPPVSPKAVNASEEFLG